MDESNKEDRKDGTSFSEQDLQDLKMIVRRTIAFEQFRGTAQKLQIFKTKDSETKQRRVSDVEAEAKVWLENVGWAEAAGILDPNYRFLLTLYPIERLHDERWFGGLYESDLCEINADIDAIREREGLDDDEYWPIGEGPEDWEELHQEYSGVLDRKFEETLREFGLHEVADLYQMDREAFDAKR